MKRYISLIVLVLILASGTLGTGCNRNGSEVNSNIKEKKLVDSLALVKSVGSLEAEITSNTKMNGQSADIKINMKIEDIKKGLKSKVIMDVLGQKQEFYIADVNGKVHAYLKDSSGNYSAGVLDSSQLNGMDIMKTFDSYIEFIKNNPDIVNKENENTYELSIPKEKTEEFCSKMTDKKTSYSYDSLKIKFVIGEDGYPQKIIFKATSGSINIEISTSYFNYNKKFNIVFPNVSK